MADGSDLLRGLQGFGGQLSQDFANRVFEDDLPLLGTELGDNPGGLLTFFTEKADEIVAVANQLVNEGAALGAMELATALDRLNGITATSSGTVVSFSLSGREALDLASLSADGSLGLPAESLAIAASLGLTGSVAYDLDFTFDVVTGDFTFVDDPSSTSLTIAIEGELSVGAEADFGLIDLGVTDNRSAGQKEIDFDIGIDLGADGSVSSAVLNGTAGFDLGLTAQIPDLPGAEVEKDISYDVTYTNFNLLGFADAVSQGDFRIDGVDTTLSTNPVSADRVFEGILDAVNPQNVVRIIKNLSADRIEDILEEARSEFLDRDLPIIGDDLGNAIDSALDIVDDIAAGIGAALDDLVAEGKAISLQTVADALDGATFINDTITVAASVAPDDKLRLDITGMEMVEVLDIAGSQNVGVPGLSLDSGARINAIATAMMDVRLLIDPFDGFAGSVEVVRDEPHDNFKLSVDAGVAFEGEGELGPLTVRFDDQRDVDVTAPGYDRAITPPEVALDLTVNLEEGSGGNAVATLSGSIGADAKLSVLPPDPFTIEPVPDQLMADFSVGFDFSVDTTDGIQDPDLRLRIGTDDFDPVQDIADFIAQKVEDFTDDLDFQLAIDLLKEPLTDFLEDLKTKAANLLNNADIPVLGDTAEQALQTLIDTIDSLKIDLEQTLEDLRDEAVSSAAEALAAALNDNVPGVTASVRAGTQGLIDIELSGSAQETIASARGGSNLGIDGFGFSLGGAVDFIVAAGFDLDFEFDLERAVDPRFSNALRYVADTANPELYVDIDGVADFDASGQFLFASASIVDLNTTTTADVEAAAGTGPAGSDISAAPNPELEVELRGNISSTGAVSATASGAVRLDFTARADSVAGSAASTIDFDAGFSGLALNQNTNFLAGATLTANTQTVVVNNPLTIADNILDAIGPSGFQEAIDALGLGDVIPAIRDGVQSFFNSLTDAIEDYVISLDLPIVGDGLSAAGSGLLALVESAETTIIDALDTAAAEPGETVFEALKRVIDTIEFLQATDRGNGVLEFEFDYSVLADLSPGDPTTDALALSLDTGFGLPGAGIDLATTLELVAQLDISAGLRFDTQTGDLSLNTFNGEKEFEVSFTGQLDADAQGRLGLLTLDAETLPETDSSGGDKPELDLRFSVDMRDDQDLARVDLSGGIDIDIDATASIAPGADGRSILPSVSTVIALDAGFTAENLLAEPDFGTDFDFALNDITVDLGAVQRVFDGVLGDVLRILNTPPIAQILKIISEPLPVLNEVKSLDQTGDGEVSLADLVVLATGNQSVGEFIDTVREFIEVAQFFADIATIAEGGISLGSIDLSGESTGIFGAGGFSLDELLAQNGANATAAANPLTSFVDGLGLTSGDPVFTTLSDEDEDALLQIPLFEDPVGTAVGLLLNGFGAAPVDLVRVDLPALTLPTLEFNSPPVFLAPFPISFSFFFNVGASLDVDFGFDTAGFDFAAGEFDLLDGLYLTTDQNADGTYDPLATAFFEIGVQGGLDLVVASLQARGGLRGTVDVNLSSETQREGGKLRISDGFAEIFNDLTVSGRISAFLDLVAKFGIGPFSIEKRFELAEIVLVDFTTGTAPEDLRYVDIDGDTMTLNVGDRANLRAESPDAIDELYQISATATARISGDITDVNVAAFGLAQPVSTGVGGLFGALTTDVTKIEASFGEGDNGLILDADLIFSVTATSGSGLDVFLLAAGNDSIATGAGTDSIQGRGGNDTIDGGADDDSIEGGAGADLLIGGDGVDLAHFISSESGIALAQAAPGSSDLIGSAGDAAGDTLRGIERIQGSSFGDTISGYDNQSNNIDGLEGDDVLTGGDLADLLLGGLGADTLDGGAGDEDRTSYIFSEAGVSVDLVSNANTGGEAEGDSLTGIEYVQLSRFDDIIGGSSADNEFVGLEGDDTLLGRGGSDTLIGGTGNDSTEGGAGDDLIEDTYGDDTARGGEGQDTIFVGGGDNTAFGDGGNDLIDARVGAGDPSLRPGNEANGLVIELAFTAVDDEGNPLDVPAETEGHNVLSGGDGEDTIIAGAGDDTIDGDAGADSIEAGEGRNIVRGGTGDDTIATGDDRDLVFGGSGFDDITSGGGNDFIDGGADGDTIRAGDGNDQIFGGSGDDSIEAGIGDDFILGEAGADTVEGGSGIDTASYLTSSGGVTISVGTDGPREVLEGSGADAEGDRLYDVEHLIGSEFADDVAGYRFESMLIEGFGGADEISGGEESDTIAGGEGADTLFGGSALATDDRDRALYRRSEAGVDINMRTGEGQGGDAEGDRFSEIEDFELSDFDDSLKGDAEDNDVLGHAGDDTLEGREGADTLDGGDGFDSVIYENSAGGIRLVAGSARGAEALIGNAGEANGDILIRTEEIVGSNFEDTIEGYQQTINLIDGGLSDDSIEGGLRNDTISGSEGADTLRGRDGDDLLFGGTEVDSLFGDAGNDSLEGGDGNDVLSGGDDQDTLRGGEGNDTLDGDGGNDTISGQSDDDLIRGGAGDDTLDGGAGRDTVEGGDGNDSIFGHQFANDTDDATLRGGAGNDTIIGDSGRDLIEGGADNDLIEAEGAADVVFGGDGDDTIEGGSNGTSLGDTLTGGAGNDTFTDTWQNHRGDLITDFTAGDRIILTNILVTDGLTGQSFDGVFTLFDVDFDQDGTPDLTIRFSGELTQPLFTYSNDARSQTIIELRPDNPATTGGKLIGEVGDETLAGGAGDELIVGLDGDDDLLGNDGLDTIEGGRGNDTLRGGTGADRLRGQDDSDSLLGGEGNDTVHGDRGDDTLDGGAGIDSLLGGSGSDSIQGGADNDRLLGEDGDDFLDGGLGNDNLEGGNGDDVLTDLSGNNRLSGGFGNNSITGGDGNDTLSALSGNDTMSGGAGNDIISVRSGANLIDGGDGADTVSGGSNSDTIDGGAGNDSLNGAQGDDSIAGGDGDDRIDPGSQTTNGFDTVTGGAGDDLFLFNTLGRYRVTDLELGERMRFSTVFSEADLSFSNDGVQTTLLIDTSVQAGFDVTIVFDGVFTEFVTQADGSSGTFVFAPVNNLTGTPFDDDDVTNPSLFGTAGDDVIDGLAGNDLINGNDGNDSLLGSEGSDTVNGGAGDDTISGGADADTLDGGLDDDLINGNDGNDSIFGGDGNDEAEGGLGRDTIRGGEGSDTLRGDEDNDSLDGGGGDDLLEGATGIDLLDGGDGNDTLDGGAGNDNLRGGDGNDVITDLDGNNFVDGGFGDNLVTTGDGNDRIGTLSGNDTIEAGSGNDTITIRSGTNTVDAGAGDDSVSAGDGIDTVIGGEGNDTIDGNRGDDLLDGGAGDDLIRAADSDTITGGAGEDRFFVSTRSTVTLTDLELGERINTNGSFTEADLLFSNDGVTTTLQIDNDRNGSYETTITLTGVFETFVTQVGGFSDTFIFVPAPNLVGTPFDDDDVTNPSLFGTPGPDTIDGLAGNDLINGAGGNDTLFGSEGSDTVGGGTGDDSIEGGLGDDVLGGGEGADTASGGEGDDTINGQAGNDELFGGLGEDSLDGGEGNDMLFGDDDRDVLVGGEGNDSLEGGLADDRLFGGDGNDTLVGGSGDDNLRGENGDDVLIDLEGNNFLDGGFGDNLITAGAGNDTLSSLDQNDTMFGGAGNDRLSSRNGDNEFHGEGGNDTISAGRGRDTMFGGSGDDILDGERGADSLDGGDGDDIIDAGISNGDRQLDTLIGGDGNDQFRVAINSGVRIFDFEAGESIRIQRSFTDVDLTVSTSADQTFLEVDSDQNGSIDTTIILDGLFDGEFGTQIDASDTRYTFIRFVPTAGLGPATPNDDFLGDEGDNDGLIDGLENNDTILGLSGDDTLLGSAGEDIIEAGFGDDSVDGGAAADYIRGHAGSNVLRGDAGNDTVTSGSGADLLSGGSGNDSILGGAGGDLLDGGANQDTLRGEDGDDLLIGGGEHDRLEGDDGQDTLLGGAGNDTLVGGAGDDRLIDLLGTNSLEGSFGNDFLQSGAGNDVLTDNSGDDTVFGGGGNDRIDVRSGLNLLDGEDGNDTIDGGSQSDTMYGGAGQDSLFGDRGSNLLSGGRGDDTLNGSFGTLGEPDTMVGGEGADLFLLGSRGEFQINDLEYGEIIDIAFDVPLSEITISNDGVNTSLVINTFGDASPDVFITLLGVYTDLSVLEAGSNETHIVATAPGTIPSAAADAFTVIEDNVLTGNVLADNGAGADTGTGLTIALVEDARYGSVVLAADGTFTYTPDTDFAGVDTFRYRADAADGSRDFATATITVTPVDDGLTAVDDTLQVSEDETVGQTFASLLANDLDADGDELAVVSIAGVDVTALSGATTVNLASGATLTVVSDGLVRYDTNGAFEGLNEGDLGTDSFTYEVSDGQTTSTATVSVTIDGADEPPANVAPVAVTDRITVDEDDSIFFFPELNDTDANGDALRRGAIFNPVNGSISERSDGAVRFRGDTDFNGTASFFYLVSDERGGASIGLVEVTVVPVNDAPDTDNDTYTVTGNQTTTVDAANGVLANDSDIDVGDTLTARLWVDATNGTLVLNDDGSFSYTPDSGFVGTDTFRYFAVDSADATRGGFVTITVEEPTDQPSTLSIAADITEAAEGDTGTTDVTYTITRDGSLVGAVEATVSVSGTADTDDRDVASLVVAFADGQSTASFTIAVNGDGFVEADETVVVTLESTDRSDVSIDNGARSATFTILNDDQAPVAADDALTTDEETVLFGNLFADNGNGEDTDDDPFTVVEVRVASGAAIAVGAAVPLVQGGMLLVEADGTVVFDPDGDFEDLGAGQSEDIVFTYTISDGVETDSGTATITIEGVNDDPNAVDDAYSTRPGGTLVVDAFAGLLANDSDIDGDGLSVTAFQAAQNGTLDVSADGSFTYTADAGFVGTETVSITVTDGIASVVSLLTIDVENLAPVVADDSYAVRAGQQLVVDAAGGVLANDADPDGDPLSVVGFQSAANGVLDITADGGLIYTPNTGFVGIETVQVTVSDGAQTVESTLTISVENEAPIAADDAYAVRANEVLTVNAAGGLLANDSDPDGDPLSVVGFQAAQNGTLDVLADGSFTYTADTDFVGTETVQITVSDGVETTTSTLTIDVRNGVPTAADDTYAIRAGTSFSVAAAGGLLANDSDPDGDTLSVVGFQAAQNGVLDILADGSFTYTPDQTFVGDEVVTVIVSDGVTEVQSVLTISVENEAPVAVDDTYAVRSNSVLNVDAAGGVLANDTDPDGDPLSVVGFQNAANGTLNVAADGSFTYVPNAGFVGTETVVLTVSDGVSEAQSSLTITIENTDPVAVDDPIGEIARDSVQTGNVLANDSDPDGDLIFVAEVEGQAAAVGSTIILASGASVRVEPDGAYTYDPTGAFTELGIAETVADQFTVTIADGRGGFATSTVSVIVGVDTDGDGVLNHRDNAIFVANADQRDTDGDGRGNIVDPDFDNNGIVDFSDYNVMLSSFGGTDPDADLNGDGIVDISDVSIFAQYFGGAPGDSFIDYVNVA